MDQVKTQARNPVIAGSVAFVLGLIIGLVVLGWWLFPVQWVDATPAELTHDYQLDYMKMAVEAYGYSSNVAEAQARYAALGDSADDVLNELAANPGTLSPDLIQAYALAVQAPIQAPGVPTVPGAEATAPVEQEAGSNRMLSTVLILLCAGALLIGAAALIYFVWRSRRPRQQSMPAEHAVPQQVMTPIEPVDYGSSSGAQPLAHWMASYQLGNEVFDDSYSIESPNGDFLGECGVGISESLIGEPKRVTAFEVWLFDKNDIQTITKVFMGEYSYSDPGRRQNLAARGEPVLSEPGIEAVLDTQSLRLIARVVDMAYAPGPMPEATFDRFVLELTVLPRN